jgi:polysaccharide biosynthesis PFTS motif protein
MIKRFLKRRAWIRLLRVLRGHRQLKELNAMGRINALKQDLASTPCIKNGAYSKLIFGREHEQAELIIRQFLLARIEATIFAKDILYSVGNCDSAITYPLPLEWRKVLFRHGFKVSKFNSIIRWNVFVILKFVSAILLFALKIFGDLKHLVRKDNPFKGRYVYFDNLSSRNFPLTSSKGPMNNIFTWYLQWSGKSPNFDSLCHDVKGINKGVVGNIPVIPLPSALPLLTKMRGLLDLLLWGSVMIFFSLIDLIRGRWWHALLFGESFKAKVFRIVDHDELAKDYLFHNSGWIYRPLWTYEAEKRGSRILFYFYSTNVEGFKQDGGYLPAYFGWKTSTWSNILVWDREQQDFVNRSIERKVNTFIVGPIWFESGVEELPELPPNSISVFDVQPVRDSLYNSLGIQFDYFIPSNCNQFIKDVYEVISKNNHIMVLKRKRNIGNLVHHRYQNLVDQLVNEPNFMSVDAEIRPEQIIDKCKAVISMPFTATSIIAREMGKPTVYYDPTNKIQKDDRGAHGIEIISGIKELEDWFLKIIKDQVIDLNQKYVKSN